MSLSSGVGSMPVLAGEDDAASYAESVRMVLGELSLPHVPEMPGRGPPASMTGRGLAVMAGLGADLQRAGWRLTDASGIDHRRARSLLAQDLDTVEELGQAWTGGFKTQVAGPWTLAATVEKPRGDKVLSDHGARRELGQALAEGVGLHVADLRRRLPGADRLVVQVDEPALPAVLGGGVPTASGFGRHRTVHPPEVSEALAGVVAAITDAGAEPWLHSCAAGTPLDLVAGAGARGLSVDLAQLSAADHDHLGTLLEGGGTVALGVLPGTDPDPASGEPAPDRGQVTHRVLRWLDMLGFDADEVSARLVLTPACGLAGASAEWARRGLVTCAQVASELSGS